MKECMDKQELGGCGRGVGMFERRGGGGAKRMVEKGGGRNE